PYGPRTRNGPGPEPWVAQMLSYPGASARRARSTPPARSRPGFRKAASRSVATSIPDPGLGEGDPGAPRRDAERDHVRASSRAGRQSQESFDVRPAVEPLALDALPVAPQDTAAHVGVERRRLDAEQAGGLLDRQVFLAVHGDHGAYASDASRPGRSRPGSTGPVNLNQV